MLPGPLPSASATVQRYPARRLLLATILLVSTVACGPEDAAFTGGLMEVDESAVSAGELVVTLPGRIQAENYRSRRDGHGYHDTTSGNSGGAYRSDRVDIERTSGGGYNVGWTAPGEWLAFEVTTTEAAIFTFTARVASATTGAKALHLNINGKNLPAATFTGTGAWQNWALLPLGEHPLPAGKHVVKVFFDTAHQNLDWIDVQRASAPAPAPG